MQSKATTVDDYMKALPEDRKDAMAKLRKEILKNIPKGFKEEMNYGMIGYVVPHTLYSKGYHCDPKMPVPFINIASQKNFIAVYHMGIYCNKKILDWFTSEYTKQVPGKLDMGKACIRFKKIEHIPFKLIGELATKFTVADWLTIYEKGLKK